MCGGGPWGVPEEFRREDANALIPSVGSGVLLPPQLLRLQCSLSPDAPPDFLRIQRIPREADPSDTGIGTLTKAKIGKNGSLEVLLRDRMVSGGTPTKSFGTDEAL